MTRIPVVSDAGEFGTIDQSEAHLIGRGFRLQTADEIKQHELKEKYGEGFGNEARAFAEGAARGASFGLSDQLLTKTGFDSPEALRARAEFNPVASGAGEVAGVVAPALLTGGATAPEGMAASAARRGLIGDAIGVAGAPVRGALELGKSAASAVTPAAESIAGKIASRESSPILNQAIERGISQGLGSAVEGAAYGLGQSISEEALGDPDLNAEKVLSNIGFNALLGGTFGSAFAGGGAFADKISQKVPSVGRMIGKEDPKDFFESIAMGSRSKEERDGILSALKKRKENAPEITSASEELGVPSFIPQLSDSSAVLHAHEVMSNALTTAGVKERQMIESAFQKVGSEIEGVLAREGAGTLAETGDKLSQSLTKRFEAEYAPTRDLYDGLKEYAQAIPVTNRSTGSIRRNILNIVNEESLIKGTPARNFVENVADSLSEITNLDQLKVFRTNLSKSAPIEAKWIAGAVKDKLDNLETNAIKRFAGTMKTKDAKSKILDLLDVSSKAKSNYRKLYERMSEFGDVLGKRRIHGPEDFMNFLQEGNTSERFAEKLFQKKNSKFTEFFKENFPDEWRILSDFEKNKILQSGLKDGSVNIRQVTKKVFGLEPEMQRALFSPEELKKLSAAKTWVDAFPPKFNPSGTAHVESAISLLDSPAKALIQNVRDYAISKGFENLGLTTSQMSQMQTLSRVERAANAITKSIDQGTRAIFNFGRKAAQATAAIPEFAEHKHDVTVQEVSDMVENPQKMFDKLEGSTQWIYHVAPKTAGALQMASVRAVTFLGSKIPKNPNPKPLSPKYIPSPAEVAKFNRYFQTIQNPTRVLKSVKLGTITSEEMEALNAVYPSLLSYMQSSVMDLLSESMAKGNAESIPYKTKMSLSMFLGQDLVQSLEPQNVASMQMTILSGPKSNEQRELNQAVKVSQAGLSNLSLSSRTQTNLQTLAGSS